MVNYKRNTLIAIFVLLTSVSCSRIFPKKDKYEDLDSGSFLGTGTYEQLGFKSSDYSNRNTEDIDKFIDTPSKFQVLKKKRMTVELDESHSSQIRKFIIRNIPNFKRCYAGQKSNKPLGVVPMNFTLNPDGKVQRAGVGESRVPIKVKACLVEKVYKIKFPPSPEGDIVRVKQPLNF